MSYNRSFGRASGKRIVYPSSSGDAQNLLLFVLRNDNDPTYALRTAAAEKFYTDLIHAPAMYQNELGRIDVLSACAKDLFAALSDTRSPLLYKNKLSQCISGIGLSYTANGHSALFTSLIFERMNLTIAGSKSKDIDRDLNNWLLTVLKEFVDAIPSQPVRLHKESQMAVAAILTQLQTFVDTMDSADYMPRTLDLFQMIAERASDQFSASFKDVVDLLVGWSIDPTLPKNVAALIFDTFKKLWRFWMPHIAFALELCRHLLGDIESAVKLSCEPGKTSLVETAPKASGHRSGRLPGNALILVRCLQSILYVLTYSGSPKLNSDCVTSLADDASEYQNYIHVVDWLLCIVEAVGRKYKDRTWLVQGLGFLKFVSKALGADFQPFHKQAMEIVMLDCSLFTAEFERGKKDSSSAEKDLMEWMINFDEMVESWLPDLSIDLLPVLTRPSLSPLLQNFRWACLSSGSCQEKLREILTTLFTALSASCVRSSCQSPAGNDDNKEELFSECSLLYQMAVTDPLASHHTENEERDSNRASTVEDQVESDDISSLPELKHLSAIRWRGTEELLDILLDDIQLMSLAAELALPGFAAGEVLLLLCSFVVGMENSEPMRRLSYKRGHLLLAAYSFAQRCDCIPGHDHSEAPHANRFILSQAFIGRASTLPFGSMITAQFGAIRSMLKLENLGHNEKLLLVVWFDELLAFLRSYLDTHGGGEVISSCIDDITSTVEECVSAFKPLLGATQGQYWMS
ncbi:hypothetical protein HDU86_005487 [Geranomyces michiganensis]|nr:hypothetical protein HDU86_005487 [Geranomyces michiganensis]